MPADYWASVCRAQGLRFLDGAAPPHLGIFGFVLGRDNLSVYPIGSFELCGTAVIYPPHTLNPTEDDLFTAVAMGLTRAWDKTGILTLRFAKQRDGGDFALLDACDDTTAEAKHLLTMRGMWDGTGASFMKSGAPVPELPELQSVGVSSGGELYTAGSLREALRLLPETARSTLDGWYERILRHDG
jgi:hypothetical protein